MSERTLGQIIGDAVCESIWVFTQNDAPIGIDDAGLMGDINRALDAEGYTIVACPPGSRVVVSRESKPCDECDGGWVRYPGERFADHACTPCGGSGVVEATTTYGLEPVADPFEVFTASDGHPAIRGRTDLWEQVALPEETPQP